MRAVVAQGRLLQMAGEYINEKTHARLQPGMYQAFLLVDDSDNFKGAVSVSNHTGTDCEVSVAGETAMAFRPHCFKAVFHYIFEQLGCVRCTCITTKGNRKGRAFIERSGFVLEGRLRQGFDGVKDALIYGLLREDCSFLGGLDGEEGRRSSASGTRSSGDGASPRSDEQGDCGSAG